MKLVHVSDTHGQLVPLPEGDVVVHSGDFLPNATPDFSPVIEEEVAFQVRWLEDNASLLRAWVGARPFVFCRGNHDFVDPVPLLRDAGVDAIDASDRHVEVRGVRFAGFPYVPWFRGAWWGETREAEMDALLRRGIARFLAEGTVDVLVTHGPLRGVLDRNLHGEHCGSATMRAFLEGLAKVPPVVLCGHIHEAAGVVRWGGTRGTLVSNAACTTRVVDLADASRARLADE